VAAPRDVYLPEVLFEFRRVGRSVRVVAIDPISGVEVIMVAPPTGTLEGVKRIAARKLAYVISKKKEMQSR
jgi:hypothetical protein